MKKKLLIPVIVLGTFALMMIFWPKATGALNPNHDCSFCHQLHDAPGQSLTDDVSVENLCLSCHGPAGTSTLKAEVHKNKEGSAYPAFTMTCVRCHDPHDNQPNWLAGTNLKMVGKKQDSSGFGRIDTPNSGVREAVFQSYGSDAGGPSLHSFADNDEDGNSYYDGICETCHTLAANHRNNSGGNHAHYTGQDCTVCHPHDNYFHASGGGCTACHGSAQDKGDGGPTRRAMTGEFSLISHHVAGGTVTDDDCGVCHYEAVDSGYHMNNQVDLRDPDDGTDATLISFAQFSRNTSSETLESWVTDVQDNFCLKCHDADGATATNFSGNALQPFSSASRNVPDTFAQFDTGNSYHHAVRGPGSNPYCVPSSSNGSNITMDPPWNQDASHDVISCFDCHGTSGHGSSNQRMLRTSIDLDTMEATTNKTNLPAGMGSTVDTFCTLCHKASVYVSASDSGAVGSIFELHGASQQQHGSSGQNELGCLGCHAGIVNLGRIPDNGTARGNIHGGSFTWPSGTFSSGTTTEHFMLGGWINGWDSGLNSKGDPEGWCSGGDCSHFGSSSKNGQKYTR